LNSNPNKPGGIYVHIPFCVKKCPYCDFYSITDSSFQPAFISALIKEITMAGRKSPAFDTLYIGGGTPSVLDQDAISRIIEAVYNSFKIFPDTEITLEVNPGTVKQDQLKGYRDSGVNRINIGVQSFYEGNLIFLGRIHTARDADMTVQWARKGGFDNIGLDLIYGIPGQTRKSWLFDLEKAVSYEPEHLSCYMLTYEPETPMENDRHKGLFKPLDDETVGDLFTATREFLADKGYAQYEISNYARSKSLRSRHNSKYWSFAPYIGLGPSAHSFMEPERRWNKASITAYISDVNAGRLPGGGLEVLKREQMMLEAIFIGLRKTDGIDVAEFDKKFSENFCKMFRKQIDDLKEKGLIVENQTTCALTPKGMLFLDSIAAMFATQDFERESRQYKPRSCLNLKNS